eukprot:UN25436
MKKDKQYIGSRYIEFFPSSAEEWKRVTSRVHRQNSIPIMKNSHIVLMSGLPYTAVEDDCLNFLKDSSALVYIFQHGRQVDFVATVMQNLKQKN